MSIAAAMSYGRLLDLIEQTPGAVALLSDSQLSRLLARLPAFLPRAASLLGEALLRVWLYETRCPADIQKVFQAGNLAAVWLEFAKQAQPLRRGNVESDRRDHRRRSPHFGTALETATWEFFSRRLDATLRADGFFPLAVGTAHAEAIAVPFCFHDRPGVDHKIRDRGGLPLANWSAAVARLEHDYGSSLAADLLVDVGLRQADLVGSSFGLPLVLAKERLRGRWVGEFRPLDVLATGSFEGRHLAEVGKQRAKADLAYRMGVKLFVSPGGNRDLSQPFAFPAGFGIEDSLRRIGAELERRNLCSLDFHGASRGLADLKSMVHRGGIRLDDAEAKRKRYERFFCSHMHPAAPDRLRECRTLEVAIRNHRGQPISSSRTKARVWGDPLNYVETKAHLVVNLTDRGELAKAEACGRSLLNWVSSGFRGSAEMKLRCKMLACGVLGGQPLLHRALREPGCAAESRQLLEGALECATLLNDPDEIARDLGQLVLWHALHDPEHSEMSFRVAEERIHRLAPNSLDSSLAYLHRARWLGAFREFLSSRLVRRGFRSWPLPEIQLSGTDWLRGTALKYRATLLAAAGETEASAAAFNQARACFGRATSPLLSFVGATVALRAGESMLESGQPTARRFLQAAERGFLRSPTRLAFSKKAEWLKRSRGLLAGRKPAELPNPQMAFPY